LRKNPVAKFKIFRQQPNNTSAGYGKTSRFPKGEAEPGEVGGAFIVIAKSFFRYGKPYNPPCPPLKKWMNYRELLLKSPFEKGGLRGI
jgi:hypothetical protein